MQKKPEPVDVLQQNFTLDGKPPHMASVGIGVTSPGRIDVALQWQGAPVTVAIRNQTTKQVVASRQVNVPAAGITYDVTAQDVAKGYLWTIEISGSSQANGVIKATYPKVNKALLDQYLASVKQQRDTYRKQIEPQIQARLIASATSKLQALQKTKADTALAGSQRIRSLALPAVQKFSAAKQAALNRPVQPARIMKTAPGAANQKNLLAGTPASANISPTDPFVNSLSPESAYPGTLITVDGVNFKADDQVFFVINTVEKQAQRTFLSSNKFQMTVPDYSSASDLTGYFYIKANKNNQMTRVDYVVEVALKATIPTITAITTADPNASGPVRPNSQILISGTGFRQQDEVHVVINNRDLVATHVDSYLNTDQQMVVTIPDADGFANIITAPVYIKNSAGTKSPITNVKLAPEIVSKFLVINEFANELQYDHNNSLNRSDPNSDGYIYFESGRASGVINVTHNGSFLWGYKGDDDIFIQTQLKNNWTVSQILWDKVNYLSADSSITSTKVGTSSLNVKVHWWNTAAFSFCYYSIGYIIEGPKGVPYK